MSMTYISVISQFSDFALYLEDYLMVNIILWDNEWDMTFDLKINVGHTDLYFMVQWFCFISSRLFDG